MRDNGDTISQESLSSQDNFLLSLDRYQSTFGIISHYGKYNYFGEVFISLPKEVNIGRLPTNSNILDVRFCLLQLISAANSFKPKHSGTWTIVTELASRYLVWGDDESRNQ